MNTVVILRGCSGAGKSTFAELLSRACPAAKICSADDYMMEDGKYVFHITKLGQAHIKCQEKFGQALKDKIPLIIVDNTNVRESDFSFYMQAAALHNYKTHVVVMENREGTKSIHAVPDATLSGQAQRLQQSIKLLPYGMRA